MGRGWEVEKKKNNKENEKREETKKFDFIDDVLA